MLGVIDFELAGRRHQSLVLDDLILRARFVVEDDDRRFLLLAFLHREPNLVAGLVVLALDDTPDASADVRHLADGHHCDFLIKVGHIEHCTDDEISASEFKGGSPQRFFDFGWILTKSESPPWPPSRCTTF